MANRARCIIALLMTMSLMAVADDRAEVAKVLDNFHDAAAKGDKPRYLSLLTDNAVFMGTDEWERWPKQEFIAYVSKRFKNGEGWAYRSIERQISFSPDVEIAWFDEVTLSEKYGRFRGTGVLLKQNGQWKITQYALALLIFNENWQEVIDLTRQTRLEKQNKK
jgi:ketosteroid isomerase-like protein